MHAICVIGGSGFVGRHLVPLLGSRYGSSVKVLIHRRSSEAGWSEKDIQTIDGDILDSRALKAFFSPGCTVINLAFLPNGSSEDNLRAAENLGQACRAVQVRRLVHLSTATVAGRATEELIDERTPCVPFTQYEKTKLAVENKLLEYGTRNFEIGILRPTAIFGPRGRNLVKLATSLLRASRFTNYWRSCLQGRRKMNLVHVANVVSAIEFIAFLPQQITEEVFIISDDEYPENNYRDVEKVLIDCFGLSPYPVASLPLNSLLPLALRLMGRSNINVGRTYDCRKICNYGLVKPVSFTDGLRDFAQWFVQNTRLHGQNLPV
jgi:nucleoside-diphosphate-sugar epimerase